MKEKDYGGESMILVSCRKDFWDNDEYATSWEEQIEDTRTSRRMTREDLIGETRNQKVLLVIHGYNNERKDVLRSYQRVARMERKWINHYGVLVGFTWPGGDDVFDYAVARDRVQGASRQFGVLLADLLGCAVELDVMSHSLGGRVTLMAYGQLPEDTGYRARHNRQFLFATAVDSDSIGRSGQYYDSTGRSSGCYVFYSTRDGTIGYGYSSQENGATALGYSGPIDRRNVHGTVRLVDCVHEVEYHGDYKRSKRIFKYIRKVVEGAHLSTHKKFSRKEYGRR